MGQDEALAVLERQQPRRSRRPTQHRHIGPRRMLGAVPLQAGIAVLLCYIAVVTLRSRSLGPQGGPCRPCRARLPPGCPSWPALCWSQTVTCCPTFKAIGGRGWSGTGQSRVLVRMDERISSQVQARVPSISSAHRARLPLPARGSRPQDQQGRTNARLATWVGLSTVMGGPAGNAHGHACGSKSEDQVCLCTVPLSRGLDGVGLCSFSAAVGYGAHTRMDSVNRISGRGLLQPSGHSVVCLRGSAVKSRW